MIWCLVVAALMAGLLVGVGLGRWMEWDELKWRLRKRLRRRRGRKMFGRWKRREPSPNLVRFGRRVINGLEPPPPDHRPHPH